MPAGLESEISAGNAGLIRLENDISGRPLPMSAAFKPEFWAVFGLGLAEQEEDPRSAENVTSADIAAIPGLEFVHR